MSIKWRVQDKCFQPDNPAVHKVLWGCGEIFILLINRMKKSRVYFNETE